MIFRAFCGEPCPEARELEHGHLAPRRACRRNPATGEVEDTDVGFPGPEHHIAERELPMKVAMGVLAVLRDRSAGSLQIPGVDDVDRRRSSSRRSPTRRSYDVAAARRPARGFGLVLGTRDRARRHRDRLPHLGAAARRRRGAARALRGRCTASSSNKWYFDELIDVARRAARSPRSARFAQHDVRARRRRRRARRRHDRRRARRLGRRARAADRLPALLRRAAAARRRRRSASTS